MTQYMKVLETTSTTFPDVDLSTTIEQTRTDGNTRLLHVTKFWSKDHIDSWVLPRWRSIWEPRGIDLSVEGTTFTVAKIKDV